MNGIKSKLNSVTIHFILGHHVVNVVIIFPKVVIHETPVLVVSDTLTNRNDDYFLKIVLYGLATVCTRNWYEDWACVECCQGDRCNRYVVVCSFRFFY